MAVARGDVLASRYRVQQVVGRGTTAVVYRAQDMQLDQTVALKVLHDSVPAGRSPRREVRVSRAVAHENVCRAHESGEDGSTRYLVRDFVEGQDLRALLRRGGPLGPELACEIAIQVARGLGAIHAAGWVHGRLSARHVLCDASHRVRLVGLRRARWPRTEPRPDRRGRGPADYMSPEAARGQAIDARSDLYSLGVLLFELLTGQLPFRGATPVLTRLQHIHEPPPLAGPRASRVPMRLLSFLEKALAKSPEDRHASADEMAAALRIAARPVVPFEPGPLPWALYEAVVEDEPLARGASMRGALTAALGVAAVASLVVGSFWLTLRTRPGPDVALERVHEPPSPFVPAAIESPPPVSVEAEAEAAQPVAPVVPQAKETAPEPRPGRAAPVRPVRHEPRQWSELAPPDDATSAMETRRVAEEPITPEVAEAVVEDDAPGRLQIGVRPWAVVRIDDRAIGETPVAPLELAPGVHTARLEHPDYQPIVRKVTVRAGETVRLQVDLGQDGVAR